MRRVLRLAARARGRTAPNPMVAGIVVREGLAVAQGHHARAGAAHGEAIALERAGSLARGATLYVNLEPCAHVGRTPPCIDAVLASGVRRVVVGMQDPDPRTSGASLQRMREAGISVIVGIEEDACRRLNEGVVSRIVRGRPFTTLKLASTLDGRIATRSGDSRWITGERARARVHDLRRRCDAIAVGSETAIIDDPELTARRSDRVVHRPRPIVVDSRLRLPPTARLFAPGSGVRPWILTLAGADAGRREPLERAGAHLIEVPARDGRLDPVEAWRRLGALGVNDLLVEGGGGLAAALLREGLVDRFHWFLAPALIGGDGRPVLGSLGVDRLGDALRPRSVDVRRVGPDLHLTLEW